MITQSDGAGPDDRKRVINVPCVGECVQVHMNEQSDSTGPDDRTLVMTTPCRCRSAAAAAVAATRAGAPSPGGARSTEYLANEPKMFTKFQGLAYIARHVIECHRRRSRPASCRHGPNKTYTHCPFKLPIAYTHVPYFQSTQEIWVRNALDDVVSSFRQTLPD